MDGWENISILNCVNRSGDSVVVRFPREREVVGSIPDCALPKINEYTCFNPSIQVSVISGNASVTYK